VTRPETRKPPYELHSNPIRHSSNGIKANPELLSAARPTARPTSWLYDSDRGLRLRFQAGGQKYLGKLKCASQVRVQENRFLQRNFCGRSIAQTHPSCANRVLQARIGGSVMTSGVSTLRAAYIFRPSNRCRQQDLRRNIMDIREATSRKTAAASSDLP